MPEPRRPRPEAPGEARARELLRDWRELVDAAAGAASSVAGRAALPRQLLGAMQRQLELAQELVERERRLQKELAGYLIAPVDAAFDLLEETGSTLRRQAEALQAAGRALDEAAGLMVGQAELFERTLGALRQPTDLARAASGLAPRARKSRGSRARKQDSSAKG
jgi:hypothetical protein